MDAEERSAQWESRDEDGPAWSAVDVLNVMGVEPTQTNVDHMEVLCDSMILYANRNEVYKDLWRVDGWLGLVAHIRHKSLRIHRLFSRHQDGEDMPKIDDAPDLINYTAMFIRLAREGKSKKYEG